MFLELSLLKNEVPVHLYLILEYIFCFYLYWNINKIPDIPTDLGTVYLFQKS